MKLVNGKAPVCSCSHASTKHTKFYGGGCSVKDCSCGEFTFQRTNQFHVDLDRIRKEQGVK